MSHPSSKAGFSVVEVVASVLIFTMAMGMSVSGYLYALKNSNADTVQDDLDMDVQLALESLKTDLRLSSLNEIYGYPQNAQAFQAISFPVAYDSDGDGILEKNEDGSIIWDETIIYHIRPTTPHQLVKTVFRPRDNSLTDEQRQAQLDSVVRTGSGTSTYNGANASSHIIFQNLLNWSIVSQAGRFDAYAADDEREIVNLGYCLLDGGSHEITFRVTGKNDASKGYHIGLDQVMLSTPTIEREAEKLTVIAQSGAVAAPEYREDGASGNYHLLFPAQSANNEFTIEVDTDLWQETKFRGHDYELDNTTIEFDQTLTPGDYVVQLKGNDIAWEAGLQTASEPEDPLPGEMQNWVVRVLQKGSELSDNGNWFAYEGRKCRLNFQAASAGHLRISDVYIGESTSTTNASRDYNASTIMGVTFNGSDTSPVADPGTTIVSDWIDMEIDMDKNYLVTYCIANDSVNCHPALWTDLRYLESSDVTASTMTCLVMTNGNTDAAEDPSWSDDLASGNVLEKNLIIGLAGIEASYPTEGSYISRIFDTGIDDPRYRDITWQSDVPAGTALSFKVRAGSEPDLSDAPDWSEISAFDSPRAISAPYKRYIQFMATFTSSEDGLLTPRLQDVCIDWDATSRLVNIGGLFAKGSDYGMLEIEVDGEPLRSALMVDLEIYKDVYSINSTTRRISSSMEVDLTPRNTGM